MLYAHPQVTALCPARRRAMASARPNPFAWLRSHFRRDGDALSSRTPREAVDPRRSRRRRDGGAFASVSMAGATAVGDPALLATETPTWGEGKPVTRDELGRAMWLFLHTLAAQYPDDPTRQQERDTRDLISILGRMYPCAECAAHFEEVVRRVPPDVSSGAALRQWTCEVHNEVNARLGKPEFDCSRVDARWPSMECDGEDGTGGCVVRGRDDSGDPHRSGGRGGDRGTKVRRLGIDDP